MYGVKVLVVVVVVPGESGATEVRGGEADGRKAGCGVVDMDGQLNENVGAGSRVRRQTGARISAKADDASG